MGPLGESRQPGGVLRVERDVQPMTRSLHVNECTTRTSTKRVPISQQPEPETCSGCVDAAGDAAAPGCGPRVAVGISQHHEHRWCHDAAVSTAAAAAPAAPVWPLLAVAGITVVGTLGATVLTLLWSARREDRRWQRERQDRHEQNRAAEYAKLVAALHAWYTALTSARAGRLNAGLLDEEPDTSDDRRQRTATREVVAMVDFMAPP